MLRAIVVGGSAALLLAVSACGSPEIAGPELNDANSSAVVATVTVTLTASNILVGQTTQAVAVARDAEGNTLHHRSIIWSASAPSVATISAGGVVNALNAGSTEVLATVDGVMGHRTVTVAPPTSSGTPAPPGSGPPVPAALAEAPRAFVNTAMPVQTGRTITVASGGNLQAAINEAVSGDVIVLSGTHVGNYVLPNKSGNGWIVIRSENVPEGRIRPGAALARVLTPNQSPAITAAAGAHHYRLIGLEVGLSGTPPYNYGLIMLGTDGWGGQTTMESVPRDIILDRMYVHGNGATNTQRCVALNAASSAVIDSHLSECQARLDDAQAIAGWNGPGPYKIVNNYLEASGENLLFGGADPSIPNLVPSDIEIRRNHIGRPTSWKGVWKVKNLLELKNARRVLVEGNVFENNWADGQDGEAILIVGVNQGGTAPWSGVQDVTFRLNVLRNTGASFLVTTYTLNGPVQVTERITIDNNLIYDVNTGIFAGTGRTFTVTGDVRDFHAVHNTIVEPTNSIISFGGGPKARMVVANNLGGGGAYGIAGDGMIGARAFQLHAPDGTFAGNVLAMPTRADEMPLTGNWYPYSLADIGFQNPAARDYRLAPSSAYLRSASGERDPGADLGALSAAIQGVLP